MRGQDMAHLLVLVALHLLLNQANERVAAALELGGGPALNVPVKPKLRLVAELVLGEGAAASERRPVGEATAIKSQAATPGPAAKSAHQAAELLVGVLLVKAELLQHADLRGNARGGGVRREKGGTEGGKEGREAERGRGRGSGRLVGDTRNTRRCSGDAP